MTPLSNQLGEVTRPMLYVELVFENTVPGSFTSPGRPWHTEHNRIVCDPRKSSRLDGRCTYLLIRKLPKKLSEANDICIEQWRERFRGRVTARETCSARNQNHFNSAVSDPAGNCSPKLVHVINNDPPLRQNMAFFYQRIT